MIDEVVGVRRDRQRQLVVDHLVGLGRGRRLHLVGERAAGAGEAIGGDGVFHHPRLAGVVAVVVIGIVADGLDHAPPQQPVARGHRGRLRGHRHQRIHHLRIALAPDPAVHAAHRIADHQPQMLDAEPLGDEPILRVDHVGIVVFRKPGLQAVGGLQRFAVADAVGNDDVVFARIERLAGSEHLAGEARRQHRCRRAAGAVQHQHRLAGRRAHGGVVQLQLRHGLAGVELEILRDPVALLWRGIVRRHRRDRYQCKGSRQRRARTASCMSPSRAAAAAASGVLARLRAPPRYKRTRMGV